MIYECADISFPNISRKTIVHLDWCSQFHEDWDIRTLDIFPVQNLHKFVWSLKHFCLAVHCKQHDNEELCFTSYYCKHALMPIWRLQVSPLPSFIASLKLSDARSIWITYLFIFDKTDRLPRRFVAFSWDWPSGVICNI